MKVNRVLFLLLIILILFSLAVRILAIEKNFSAEETDFVKPAIAIMNTGEPLFYLSEQQPHELALWHPPMYIYSLGILFKLFGSSEIVARLPNIIFSLLTALLIFIFCATIPDVKNKKLLGIIASTFFLINYYVFSSSILIDIDGFSTFFVFAFIFSIIAYYKNDKMIYAVLASLSLLFSLANRYPISILVYLGVGVYTLISLRKKFKSYFLIGFSGALAFLIIWTAYSTLVEPGTFFSFLVHNVRLGSEQLSSTTVYFLSFLLNISQFTRLITFPALILFLTSLFYFLKRKEKPIRILIIYTLIILAFFFIIPRPAFGYPRYFLSAFPGISILIALLVTEAIQKIRLDSRKIVLLLLCFFGTIILLLVFAPQSTFYQSNGLIKATNLPDFIINLVCIAPILFILFVKNKEKYFSLILMLAIIFLAYSLYFDMQLVLNQSHIQEVGNYVKEHTSSGDLIICPKAVGYYANRAFYVNDYNKPDVNSLSLNYLKQYLVMSIVNKKMNSEFFWEKGYFGGINPPRPTEEILDSAKYVVLYHKVNNTEPEKQIGNFYIYNLSNINK